MKARLANLRHAIDPRLYPVIGLLLAALVIVPGLLRDSGGASAAPAAAATSVPLADPASATAAVVTLDAPKAAGGRRLGRRQNPFKREKQAAEDGGGPGSSASASDEAGTRSATSGTGASASKPADPKTAPTPASTPTPTATTTPTPAAETGRTYGVLARFGPAGEPVEARSLERLAVLPSTRRPVLLLMGLRRDHETAVFLVAAGTGVSGAGDCWPAPGNCKQLALRGGETAVLATAGQTFAVELRPVRERTVSGEAAERARDAVAPGGRMALRTMLDRVGPLRWNPSSGVLNTLDGRSMPTP